MTTASILALLQMALTLLALVQSTPNLPQPMRDYAVQIAQQAITQATQAMGQTTTLPPVSSSFPGVTLNVTPYSGTTDTFVANVTVGKWTDYSYEIDWGEGDSSIQTRRSRVMVVCNNQWNCAAPAGQIHQYGTNGEFPIALYAVKNGVRTLVARASARVSSLASTAPRIAIKEPGNSASVKVGSPIFIEWRVENAPQNAQVLLRLEGINTSGGISGGTWQSQKLPVGGQDTQSYYWQTGNGYLDATGSYRLTAYIIACEPQGCSYNYDSQAGLGRTRYATSQSVTFNVVPELTETAPYVTLRSAPSPVVTTSSSSNTINFSLDAGVENTTNEDIFIPLSSAMTFSGNSAPAGAVFQIEDNFGGIMAPSTQVSSSLVRVSGGAETGSSVRIQPGQSATLRVSATYAVSPASGRSYRMRLASVGWGRSPNASTPQFFASASNISTPWTSVFTSPAPTINSFAASSNQVGSGQSVTLSWSASNSINEGGCYIFANPGSTGTTITANGNWGFSGTHTVNPTVTTTFTLRCFSSWKDGSQSVTSAVTVTVVEANTPPAITMSAAWGGNTITSGGMTVPAGQTVRLQWNAQSASSCTVTSTRWLSENVVQTEWSTVSGDVNVTAQSTSVRYTVSCQGSGGTASKFVQINPLVNSDGGGD